MRTTRSSSHPLKTLSRLADISKINAVAIANVAKLDAVLAANIAKVNGLVFATGGAFLLDTYTGAAAAYSVRQLRTGETISMRIRRDTAGGTGDDDEADVAFDTSLSTPTISLDSAISNASGGVSASTFGEFVAASGYSNPDSLSGTILAYVDTWMDQSGNGVDAEQNTHGSQPQIYNGSAVITENGKPAVQFDGSNDGLTMSSLTYGNELTLISLYNQASTGSRGRIWCDDITGQQGYWILFGDDNNSGYTGDSQKTYINDGAGFDSWTHQTAPKNQQNLLNIYFSSSQIVDSLNGTAQTQSVTGFSPPINLSGSSAGFAIGNSGNMTYATEMKGQEFILYHSDESSNRSAIEGNVNAYFQVGNFGTPTSGLLSTYTGAAAAYSVRQLANTAALCMRVRRDNDDAEQDFGFDANGDLDTAAIATFVGSGNNGYVVTWYDQSGNTNNATQSTDGSQPQIYNGSAVITENGKPGLDFDGSNDCFDLGLTNSASDYSLFVVNKADSESHNMFDTQTGRLVIERRGSSTFGLFYDGAHIGTRHSGTTQQLQSIFLVSPSSAASFVSGSQINSGLSYTQTAIGGTTVLGSNYPKTSLFYEGRIQAFILYPSDQSSNRSGIETDINNYFSIY